MALNLTTLSAAVTGGPGVNPQKFIVVAWATGAVAGGMVQFGDERAYISKEYVSGTTLPLLRGVDGSYTPAHVSGEQVKIGLKSDFGNPTPQTDGAYPPAGRGRTISTITATGAWLPEAGAADQLVVLNGTSVIALTITNPGIDQDGKVVTFAGNGKAAHTITYTTVGFGNVGANADLITFGTTQAQCFSMIACGGFWLIYNGLSTATANVSGPAVA